MSNREQGSPEELQKLRPEPPSHDWSLAPADATHYQPHQRAYYKRVSATEWFVWSRLERESHRWMESPAASDNAVWIKRPSQPSGAQGPCPNCGAKWASVELSSSPEPLQESGRGAEHTGRDFSAPTPRGSLPNSLGNEHLYQPDQEWMNAPLGASQPPFFEEAKAERAKLDEMAMLVRRLVHSLKRIKPDSELPAQAMDYLRRHGLQGSPLRESPTQETPADLVGDLNEALNMGDGSYRP